MPFSITQKMNHALIGQYLAIDGPDGSGKSTLVQKLFEVIHEIRTSVLVIREPGSTPYGEQIRKVLLTPGKPHGAPLEPTAELLLFMAARAQLAREKIIPLLSNKVTVLSDRCVASSFAYQGTAHGISVTDIQRLYEFAVPFSARPMITIILDVPEEISRERLIKSGKSADRIEQLGADFHKRVRNGYLAYADTYERTLLVDASGSLEATFDQMIRQLITVCSYLA